MKLNVVDYKNMVESQKRAYIRLKELENSINEDKTIEEIKNECRNAADTLNQMNVKNVASLKRTLVKSAATADRAKKEEMAQVKSKVPAKGSDFDMGMVTRQFKGTMLSVAMMSVARMIMEAMSSAISIISKSIGSVLTFLKSNNASELVPYAGVAAVCFASSYILYKPVMTMVNRYSKNKKTEPGIDTNMQEGSYNYKISETYFNESVSEETSMLIESVTGDSKSPITMSEQIMNMDGFWKYLLPITVVLSSGYLLWYGISILRKKMRTGNY